MSNNLFSTAAAVQEVLLEHVQACLLKQSKMPGENAIYTQYFRLYRRHSEAVPFVFLNKHISIQPLRWRGMQPQPRRMGLIISITFSTGWLTCCQKIFLSLANSAVRFFSLGTNCGRHFLLRPRTRRYSKPRNAKLPSFARSIIRLFLFDLNS